MEKIKNMIVKEANLSNYDDYFYLRCDPNGIKWSGHSSKPDYSNLKTVFLNRYNNLQRKDFLFYIKDKVVGFGYYDLRTGDIDIGIGIHSDYLRNGYGYEGCCILIDFIKQDYPSKQIITVISNSNIPAQKLATKLNFINTNKKVLNSDFGIQEGYGASYLYIRKGD